MEWSAAEAQGDLDGVLDKVLSDGPQFIRDGDRLFVVRLRDEAADDEGGNPVVKRLLAMRDADDLEITRNKDLMREIDFD